MEQNVIDEKYKWDLTKFCKSKQDFEVKLKKCEEMMPSFKEYKGKLNDDKKLFEFWQLQGEMYKILSPCFMYACLLVDTNNNNSEYKEMQQVVGNLETKYDEICSFATAEYKTLDDDYLNRLKNDPKFKDYELRLDSLLTEKKHLLTEKEEMLLAQSGSFAGGIKKIYESCQFSDMKFEDALDSKGVPHKVTDSLAGQYFYSNDRELRKNVAVSKFNGQKNYENVLASTFIAQVQKNDFYVKARNYDSVIASTLEGDKVPVGFYDNCINGVKKSIPEMHQFYEIRKKMLGYDKMYTYDKFAPLIKEDLHYSFEDACGIVRNVLGYLGDEYIALFNKAVKERWFDVYPKDDKRSGGYCWGCYGITPVVLLNWTNKFDDVSTLAHEFGHAAQDYFINQNQPLEKSGINIFMAEVASTFNEIILRHYMMDKIDNIDAKINLLESSISNALGTTCRQVMYSEFEDFAYKAIASGEPLSLDKLSNKWMKLQKEYDGKAIEITDKNSSGWMGIWHFYNLSYYVYQYAVSYVIANNFAKAIIEKKPNALQNYKDFIKSGGSDYPLNILKKCGIDMLSEEPYKAFKEQLHDEISQLEELLKKKQKINEIGELAK